MVLQLLNRMIFLEANLSCRNVQYNRLTHLQPGSFKTLGYLRTLYVDEALFLSLRTKYSQRVVLGTVNIVLSTVNIVLGTVNIVEKQSINQSNNFVLQYSESVYEGVYHLAEAFPSNC
jgi:hypothetical protein